MQLTLRHGYFRTVFLTRLSEWQSAVITMMWGLTVVLPASTYGTAAGYSGFRMIIDQQSFGGALILIGAGRLFILGVNGLWKPMYFFRAGAALLTTMVWTAFVVGFAMSGTFGSWVAIIPAFLIFETANVFRAMNDAAAAEREARRVAVA